MVKVSLKGKNQVAGWLFEKVEPETVLKIAETTKSGQ
jgi:hypothetical protein